MNCKSVTPELKLELQIIARKPASVAQKPARACHGNCNACPNRQTKKR
jgi:hypothetical protein